MRFPFWAFSSPRWTVPALTASPPRRGVQDNSDLSGPSMTMPLVYWGALHWTKHSRRAFTTTKQRGRITSLLMQSRVRLALFFFCCEGKLSVHAVQQDLRVLRKAAFQLIHPQQVLVHGEVISPNLQYFAFFLIEEVTLAYSPPDFYQYTQGNTLVVFLQFCSCAVVISTVPLSRTITWLICWAGMIFASPKPAFGSA